MKNVRRRVFVAFLLVAVGQAPTVYADPARSAATARPSAAARRSAVPAPATETVTAHDSGSGGTPELLAPEFSRCQKMPPGRRVKVTFKPDSEISDLIGWFSTVSCTGILISGPSIQGKKVTILSPQVITFGEAYSLFLGALDSVGLTVEPMGRFLRVIESSKARFSPLPLEKSPGGSARDDGP
jgi:general secretion pathway protein D